MQPRIFGVYHTYHEDEKVRAGKARRAQHWLVLELPEGQYAVNLLDDDWLPGQSYRIVSRPDFGKSYVPDPVAYREKVLPRFLSLRRYLLANTTPLEVARLPKAEKRLYTSLAGGGRMEAEDAEKRLRYVMSVLEVLPEPDDSFVAEQTGGINRMGMSLRKAGDLAEAERYYQAAMALSPSDDHLFFNMARLRFDQGDFTGAAEFLDKALDLNPQLHEAKRFRKFIEKRTAQPSTASGRLDFTL